MSIYVISCVHCEDPEDSRFMISKGGVDLVEVDGYLMLDAQELQPGLEEPPGLAIAYLHSVFCELAPEYTSEAQDAQTIVFGNTDAKVYIGVLSGLTPERELALEKDLELLDATLKDPAKLVAVLSTMKEFESEKTSEVAKAVLRTMASVSAKLTAKSAKSSRV